MRKTIGFIAFIIATSYSPQASAHKESSQDSVISFLGEISNEPILDGNHVQVLIDGPEFFDKRLELINNARSSIGIFMYLWCPDYSGMKLAEALAAASRRGVEVRVAVDFFNNKNPSAVYSLLEQGGVELIIFNPPRWGWRLNDRMHEKIMLVDGDTVIMGGANLCDEYMIPEAKRSLWHEYEILIHGPGAVRAQSQFDQTWEWILKQEKVNISRYSAISGGHASFPTSNFSGRKSNPYPSDPFSNNSGRNPLIFTENLQNQPIDPQKIAALFHHASDSSAPPPSMEANEKANSRVMFHYQQPYKFPEDTDIALNLYSELFDSAKETIFLHTPYMAPPKTIKNSLISAASRGINVIIITNSPETNDLPAIFSLAARVRYRQLIEGGVRIFESPIRTLHGKAIVVDEKISVVGSHNFTHRSFFHNGEMKFFTDDSSAAKRLSKLFESQTETFREMTLPAFDKKEPSGIINLAGRIAGYFY